jgi:hypothetical protein
VGPVGTSTTNSLFATVKHASVNVGTPAFYLTLPFTPGMIFICFNLLAGLFQLIFLLFSDFVLLF